MTDTPEFHRPQRIDTIGEGISDIAIDADAAERTALALRFGLLAVDRLDGRFSIRREGQAIVARGRVGAAVVQMCVATGDPLPASVDETVVLRFVTDDVAPDADDIELSAADCDTILYTGSAFDLGEAAAETMMLALDPFPRGPHAEAVLRAAGVKNEAEAGPFGALASLKTRLSGD